MPSGSEGPSFSGGGVFPTRDHPSTTTHPTGVPPQVRPHKNYYINVDQWRGTVGAKKGREGWNTGSDTELNSYKSLFMCGNSNFHTDY